MQDECCFTQNEMSQPTRASAAATPLASAGVEDGAISLQDKNTVMSVLCDKSESNEERTRTHRHCLRTSLGGRVLRNRRYRPPFDDNRHTKRLFTPEIKKYLKDWLIRRRDHPYPNREEKRNLAVETGLTYIQICNWFANWRRKLKNAGSEEQRTWSHLIKSYNTQAEGNVEQFSISSDDSIWERRELLEDADGLDDEDDDDIAASAAFASSSTAMDHCYSVLCQTDIASTSQIVAPEVVAEEVVPASVCIPAENQPQCFMVSSTTTEDEEVVPQVPPEQNHGKSNKYKRHIMEKYMKDLRLDATTKRKHEWERSRGRRKSPKMLSKWLESTAKFQPTKSYVPWTATKKVTWPKKSRRTNSAGESKVMQPATSLFWPAKGHQRAELDAAEALTCLSGLH